MKICIKCQKESDSFYKSNTTLDGLGSYCKECNKLTKKEWDKKNREKTLITSKKYRDKYPDRVKNQKLLHCFGITLEQYNKMLSDQSNCCKICNRNASEFKYKLAVDHCHKTNEIRGLLCIACNRGISYFKDDPELCIKASIYLDKSKKKR